MSVAISTTATPNDSQAASSLQPNNSAQVNPDGVEEHKKKRGRHKPRDRRGESHSDQAGIRPPGDAADNRQAQQANRGRNDGQRRRNKARGPTLDVPPMGHSADTDSPARSGRSTPSAAGSGSSRGGRRDNNATSNVAPPRGAGRRRNIGSKLTDDQADGRNLSTAPPHQAAPQRTREQKADTLTNRLIDSLRTPPYTDCPICFSSIHPAQPIWSCSPDMPHNLPFVDDAEGSATDTQCCYTPFHLKCIKSWASKSVKDMHDAYRARGEINKVGEWRCPGCQRRRLHIPQSYMCFCGSTPDPRPARLATPHSCGNPCSRSRVCGHTCPIACHPGPCPPCQVTVQLPCHCNRQTKTFRCAEFTAITANSKAIGGQAPAVELSCGQTCSKILDCGRHSCPAICHPGPCAECPIVETSRCYCGKEERQLKCGEGEVKHSFVMNGDVLEEWDGRFACEKPCGRLFDCAVHKCEKSCHSPSASPPPCPRSPSSVSHCPCGKRLLTELEGGTRQKCTDPILTCGNMCMKTLDGCEHVCSVPCHTGPCPPCAIPLIIPCRCGSTTRAVPCHESKSPSGPVEILCDKPCGALRACGRHQCNRLCCPLASLSAVAKGKGKKRLQALSHVAAGLEDVLGAQAHWHECDLVCGRLLGCGNHHCEERDHKGACPPCLRSSFDEMICYCGQTVIEPPVPCGTRISCSYPCSRPTPPCGHPKSPHTCHEDPTPCPPCPFLTSKLCACGKNAVSNVRCSQEKVSCGTVCGKLLGCGFHHCDKPCHGGDCGTCTAACGKPRKLCLPAHHSCISPCHAPSACSEEDPCSATVTLKCPCGRIQQASFCGRCTANPAGREATQQPKCTNECAIAKRNARLAEALGISQDVKDRDGQKPVIYADELVSFARANAKFCTLVEKTFADFVLSEKKSHVLPYMHELRRNFVHDLAAVYRMDTQLVDQEPRRSVQLIRRIDTRIPKPLLSAAAASNNLGRLTDLRAIPPTSTSTVVRQATPTTSSLGAGRGWTSVVSARLPSQSPSTPLAWGAHRESTGVTPSTRPPGTAYSSARPLAIGRPLNVGEDRGRVSEHVPDSWESD